MHLQALHIPSPFNMAYMRLDTSKTFGERRYRVMRRNEGFGPTCGYIAVCIFKGMDRTHTNLFNLLSKQQAVQVYVMDYLSSRFHNPDFLSGTDFLI